MVQEFKIQSIKLRNYGNISSLNFHNLSRINIVVGENSTGKTFLLKALYSAIRTMEDYMRGDDIRAIDEILSEKLRWTFQSENLGDIVNYFTDEKLHFELETNFQDIRLKYKLSKYDTTKAFDVVAPLKQKPGNSFFIPEKEILSTFNIILKSREIDRSFGFDDTYYDLAKAISHSSARISEYQNFSRCLQKLNTLIHGQVYYNENSCKWFYKDNSMKQNSVNLLSEGLKRISIVHPLIYNGYINPGSVVFIDDFEAALDSNTIYEFLDIVSSISREIGIQMFISTHSKFVLETLRSISLDHHDDVTYIELSNGIPSSI